MKSAATILEPDQQPLDLTLLVFPGSSIMTVASAVDPLRAANRILGDGLLRYRFVSMDGQPPLTTCDLPVAVSGTFQPERPGEVVIVIAGFGALDHVTPALLAGLRRAVKHTRAIVGVEAGAWLLARAGLLDGRAATTHWEDFEDFAAAFPEVDLRPDRYVIDGQFLTTGGASPTFDLMLHLIRSRFGMAVALDVASVFIYDQTRSATDAQPLVTLGRLGGYDPRLARALRMMEDHIDRPLTTGAIAKRIGVASRTLETMFKTAIDETPGAYYLRLRLSAARRLVVDTRTPIADIAVRTGFSSTPVFSRAYSKAFGNSPSENRSGLRPDKHSGQTQAANARH